MTRTRKDSLHLHNTIPVRRPHPTQEGSIISMQIRRPHRIVRNIQLLQKRLKRRIRRQPREAGVTTRIITMPEINQHPFQRLTSRHVQHTHVQPQRHPGLALGHVLAQGLRLRPPVRSLGDLGGEHAGFVLDCLVVGCFGGDLHGGVPAAAGSLG